MLSRYHDTIRTPFDVLDTVRFFNDLEGFSIRHHRADFIDEEGIKIEMPGVKSSDLEVTVQNKTLKVSGKSRHGKEFNYSYSIKSSVDESLITAKLEDGLLSISLPKKPDSSPRKITVTT